MLCNARACTEADFESFGFHITNSKGIYFYFSLAQLKKQQQKSSLDLTDCLQPVIV